MRSFLARNEKKHNQQKAVLIERSSKKQNLLTMKTNLLPKGLKIAFLALLLPLTGVNAQNLTLVETRPDAMTVCMGNYPFSLKIKNNTGSAVSSMQLRLDLPDYIQYTGLSLQSRLSTS